MADDGGTLQERYAYIAYREPKYLDARYAARTGSSYAWVALYTGGYLDAVSGIYYFSNQQPDDSGSVVERDSYTADGGRSPVSPQMSDEKRYIYTDKEPSRVDVLVRADMAAGFELMEHLKGS